MTLEPKLIVCDEPVAALDVSVRAQVLNLMQELQEERGLTYLFISHDLALVEVIADRVAVMRAGKIVEIGEAGSLYRQPQHEYTKELLSAIPVPLPPSARRPGWAEAMRAASERRISQRPLAAHRDLERRNRVPRRTGVTFGSARRHHPDQRGRQRRRPRSRLPVLPRQPNHTPRRPPPPPRQRRHRPAAARRPRSRPTPRRH